MSKLWASDTIEAAKPVAGWGAFGSVGRDGQGFRTLYADGQSNRGWNVTFPGEPADAAPERPDPAETPEAFVDPVEEAAREAFVQGFHEGERITRETLECDNGARLELAAAIEALAKVDEGTFATLLSQAVIRLVGQIIGEVPIDAEVLQARCEAVAACIDGEDTKGQLEVNPEDLPLLEAETLSIALVGNPALPRGSVRLATAEGWVEDGPDVRMARLKALMDDMEGRL